MRNLTLKKRFSEGIKVRKNDFIQKVQGTYKCTITRSLSQQGVYGLDEFLKLKPKTFSFRNWVFPYLVMHFPNNTNHETMYQELKEVHDNGTFDIDVYVSGKMQHLSMCFDTPHFSSCGMDKRYEKCSNKIQSPDVFCVFTRDKSGKINARIICKSTSTKLMVYGHYGIELHRESLLKVVNQIKGNLTIEHLGSFL